MSSSRVPSKIQIKKPGSSRNTIGSLNSLRPNTKTPIRTLPAKPGSNLTTGPAKGGNLNGRLPGGLNSIGKRPIGDIIKGGKIGNNGRGTNNGRPGLTLPGKIGDVKNLPGKNTLPWMPNSNNGGNNNNKNKNKFNWKDLAKNIVKTQLHKNHWCQTRPHVCTWWNAYCKPIAHCHHNEIVVCDWHRVTCCTAALPTVEVQWYLGMKGILLPGKGIGIDTVEPGSPAEAVGLQPGMVLTVCNGIQIVDEGSMSEAIRISGGILNMTLLSADGSQLLEGTVQMTQVASVSL